MRCAGAQAGVDYYEDVNDWLQDINLWLNPVGSYTSCVFLVIDMLVRQIWEGIVWDGWRILLSYGTLLLNHGPFK